MMAHCPECGSPDTTPIRGMRGDLAPGEWVLYQCADCPETFWAVMPEPPEAYEGNSVFAENH